MESTRLPVPLRAVPRPGVAWALRRVLVGLSVALGAAHAANAQAPFNTAVLGAGERQARIDVQAYVAPQAHGGWTWALPSVTAGLGHGLEVGVGVSQISPRPVTSAPLDLTLSARWAPFADRAAPVQFAVGTFTLVPSRRSNDGAVAGATSFLYLAASRSVLPRLGDASPVLTIAGYAVDGVRPPANAHAHGAMVAVDQPLPTRWARALGLDALQLNTSWVTGETLFGYASATVQVMIGPLNASLGYARGNVTQFNHGPMAGLGIAF